MGRDKGNLPHPDGGTFLQHALDRLRVVCKQVVVSTSADQANHCSNDVAQVVDPVAHQGPIVGVVACLHYARQNEFAGCLCTPVDMPDLTTEDLNQLLDAWIENPGQLIVAMEEASGHLDPLVAIYPSRVADALREVAESDDRSLSRWIDRQSPIRVPLPPRRNVNSPDEL